jgi:predicted AlkP superfamily phosphohydrolase/phosphomutase
MRIVSHLAPPSSEMTGLTSVVTGRPPTLSSRVWEKGLSDGIFDTDYERATTLPRASEDAIEAKITGTAAGMIPAKRESAASAVKN